MLPAVMLDFMENSEWYRYDERKRRYILTEKASKRAVKSYNVLYIALGNRYYRVENMLSRIPAYMVCATLFWIVNPLMDAHQILNPDFFETKNKKKPDPYNIRAEAVLFQAAKAAVENGLYMPCGLNEDELGSYFMQHEIGHLTQNRLFSDELIKRGWSPYDTMKFVDRSYTDPYDPRRYKWYYDVLKEVAALHRREIVGIAGKADPGFSEIKSLSKVAMMNDEEFFAEAYANSQLSMPNEIGRGMKEWLAGQGLN